MAFIPDLAIENFHLLTTAEIKIFSLYCKKRNKQTGGWFCPDVQIAEETRLERETVFRARKSLQKRGWIKRRNNFVIPVFGFDVTAEQQNVTAEQHEAETMLPDSNIMLPENNTMLPQSNIALKESYQPILPAHLTSDSADLLSANSAKPTAENNFVNSLPLPQSSLDESQPARKPTLQQPASTEKSARNGASAGKPAETRSDHPAIQMVKKITGRYPPKDQWDKIIREIGDAPDVEFFRSSWEIWRSFDGKPTNLQGWLFQPNERGKLPEVFGNEMANGNQKTNLVPFEKPKQLQSPGRKIAAKTDAGEISPTRREGLDLLADMIADNLDISGMKQFYSPEDWAWLMEQLKTE